jgi:hypothetical protein
MLAPAPAGTQDERPLVVDAVDDARDGVAPEADADGLAGEDVVVGPKFAERTGPVAFFELLPGAEERGDDPGGLAVEVERGAERGLEGTGRRAQFGGEILRGAGQIEADAEDELADRIGVETRFGEHARDLASVGRLQVIRPLESELQPQRLLDVRAEGEAHPERERLEPFRRNEGTEGEREVEVAGGRAVPLAAEPSASGLLRAGEDRERRFLADGETTLRFGVGAVDLGEELDFRRDLQQAEMRVEQGRIEMARHGAQRVALARRGAEDVTRGTQALEPAPDRHPGDAELLRETVAADRFAVRFEEGQEDAAVEVGHDFRASRGRDRTTAPRG